MGNQINIANAIKNKLEPRLQVEIKGMPEIRSAIRSGGGTVANKVDVPTTELNKTASEDQEFFMNVCKSASILPAIPKGLKSNLPNIIGLGTAGISFSNSMNEGDDPASAGLKALAMGSVGKIIGHGIRSTATNVNAMTKTKELLYKGLKPEEIQAGAHKYSNIQNNFKRFDGEIKNFDEYSNLKNKVNISPSEKQKLDAYHQDFSMKSFDQQHSGDLGSALKGKTLKLMGEFNPKVRQDILNGAYSNPDNYYRSMVENRNNISNAKSNLDYVNKNNLDVEKVTHTAFKNNQNPDELFNLNPNDFANHKVLREIKPTFRKKIGDKIAGN